MSEVAGMTRCVCDIMIESPRWDGEHAADESWVRRVVAAALAPENAACELAIVFADDASVRALNARFRGRDAPTNVLSFPPPSFAAASGETRPLGDIVIAFETARTEAAAQGKEFFHHVTHLLVHGVLHLLGYDHQSDVDAELMEMRERDILQGLGIPDPYQERGGAAGEAAADTASGMAPPACLGDPPPPPGIDASPACACARERA